MDGVTLLQVVPGKIDIPQIFLCLILGIMGLFLIMGAIAAIIEGENKLSIIAIPGVILIISSLIIGFSIHNNRLTLKNRYYYATIEDNVTMNEFFKYYDLISHESDSSLWLIKEKNIQTEEN